MVGAGPGRAGLLTRFFGRFFAAGWPVRLVACVSVASASTASSLRQAAHLNSYCSAWQLMHPIGVGALRLLRWAWPNGLDFARLFQATLRIIYSYLSGLPREEAPTLDIPLHTVGDLQIGPSVWASQSRLCL